MIALTVKERSLRMIGIFAQIIDDQKAIHEKLSEYGITPPNASNDDGFRNRLLCSKWWGRTLTRKDDKEREEYLINKGNVRKGKQIYVSNNSLDVVDRRQQRAQKIMASKMAVADTGEQIDMETVMRKSIANPANRLAELMVRMSGFEDYAKEFGHAGEFYTITTPSKFHKYSGNGVNKKHAHNPKEAQQYLVKLWSKIRASFQRQDINVYGFRVAEPHHDGTPHWHMLLFMEQKHRQDVRQTMHDYACSMDSDELTHIDCFCPVHGAKKVAGVARCSVRFDYVEIDSERGSATGYIAKYIAKNIGFNIGQDSEDETKTTEDLAGRVKAWASTWGIRQFQQIGGSSVSVWRELRRLSDDDLIEDEVINDARKAADESNWVEFLKIMGGADAGRVKQKIQLLKKNVIDITTGEMKMNQYEEVVIRIFGICTIAIAQITRFKTWQIMDKTVAENLEREECTLQRASNARDFPPWSSVNNCILNHI